MSNVSPNPRCLLGLLRLVDAAAFDEVSARLRGRSHA